MQPPFSKTSVATTTRLMAPLIDEIIDQWQPGKPIDMFSEMRVLSNWVAANVLFGNEDIAASLHIGDLIDRWIVLEARTRRWGMIERDLPGLPYRTELRHAERLEDTIRKMLEQKRVAGLSGGDVLSVLLRAADSREAGMKDADLIAHSVSLYGASFETTAGALAWTLFLIAQHPLCAARLHDEVSQLEEWPPDSSALESSPFLDAVVRESLRLMPSVPFTFRRPARPLEFAGVPLRLGDKVVVSQFLTNRDPDVFPDPYRFDPSRWFGPRPTPYQYIPFNAGPRMCLGAGFATAEIKLVVARIMQKYRLTVVPQARIDATVHLVLKPRSGLPMNAHPQDRAFQRSPVRGNILQLIDLVSPEQEPSGDSVLSAA